MSTEDKPTDAIPVNTVNEYMVGTGQNLGNSSYAKTGLRKFVRMSSAFGNGPVFRTRQQVYRLCAWLLALSEVLPDEEGAHSFEQVSEAIRNT